MVESGVASTAYSLENTPDCKTLLARFCSRNAHLGRPTYTVIEELRMKRVFYRCRVDMASQSFTSRSYHTKKKDAEQDAAFEMVKCLCPQYLSEKEKLLPYATKNSFFVGSEAYRNPLDLGEGKTKGCSQHAGAVPHLGAAPMQPSIVPHTSNSPTVSREPVQYDLAGIAPVERVQTHVEQHSSVPDFSQEIPCIQVTSRQSSNFHPGTAAPAPNVHRHTKFSWLNHTPNTSYADDITFDELQSLSSMTNIIQKSSADQHHSNAIAPISTALSCVCNPSAWLAYPGVPPNYAKDIMYHMPPLGFVTSQLPSASYSQSPISNAPNLSISAVSCSPVVSAAPARSSTPPSYNEPSVEPSPLYKVRLQEILHTTQSRGPQYMNTSVEGGFTCSAVVCGREFQTKKAYKNKKLGQYAVAYEALQWLEGSHNDKLRNCHRDKCNDQSEDSVLIAENRKRKHFTIEESPAAKRLKRDVTLNPLPSIIPRDLIVVEIWGERRSMCLVGNKIFSVPLFCRALDGQCALYSKAAQQCVILEPGYRICGLDGHIAVHNGHVELVAIDCEYVENADDDDRVLVSCGVVLIHQSNGSDSPSCQVLLKRYLKSLPFIELLGFLSQFFRRLLHLKGPVKDSLEHLKRHAEKCVFWDQDELEAVSRLDIATAFQGNVVSFDSRWKQYLEEPLPEELKLLQAKASEELRRRKNNESQLLADQKNRRWGLPKGNFRHRCLSGGIYIEPPHLCALRELKEETGLELSIAELLDAPSVQIDKPSVDGRPSIHQAMDMYCLRLIPPGWRHKEQDDGKGDSDSSGPPPVKGGSHEECCWLELGEARKVCAALDAVASSPEFDRLFQRT